MTSHLPQSANDVTSIIQMYLSPPQKSIPSIGGLSSTLPRPIGIQYKGFLNSLVHDFMMYNDRKLYKAMSKVDQWKDGQIQTTRALEVFKQIDPPYEREVALEVADKLERNGEINVCSYMFIYILFLFCSSFSIFVFFLISMNMYLSDVYSMRSS